MVCCASVASVVLLSVVCGVCAVCCHGVLWCVMCGVDGVQCMEYYWQICYVCWWGKHHSNREGVPYTDSS